MATRPKVAGRERRVYALVASLPVGFRNSIVPDRG